jgi:hypothetical protein
MKQISDYTTRQLELMNGMMLHDWIQYDDLHVNVSDEEMVLVEQRLHALSLTMAAISIELMIRPR